MFPGTCSHIFGALLVALHVATATVAQAQVNSRDTQLSTATSTLTFGGCHSLEMD